jgi:hypothetical protein
VADLVATDGIADAETLRIGSIPTTSAASWFGLGGPPGLCEPHRCQYGHRRRRSRNDTTNDRRSADLGDGAFSLARRVDFRLPPMTMPPGAVPPAAAYDG